jgi:hypothetical protein
MSDVFVPARFLYRFALPCRYRAKLWSARGAGLPERYRLAGLAELEGRPAWADVRAAWNAAGLAFAVRVQGKKQPPSCRADRPEEGDGVQVWLDTRDVHNVHRAGRFCHRFVFLPAGEGPQREKPLAASLPIHRAKEPARPVAAGVLKVRSVIRAHGYLLECYIPDEALLGFDPAEHPRLGFTYALLDREHGEQTLTVGSPMPYQEDPSLWATLELIRGGERGEERVPGNDVR